LHSFGSIASKKSLVFVDFLMIYCYNEIKLFFIQMKNSYQVINLLRRLLRIRFLKLLRRGFYKKTPYEPAISSGDTVIVIKKQPEVEHEHASQNLIAEHDETPLFI